MTRLRVILFRLWALIRCRRMDRDMDDQIASHLAEAKDEYIQQGLSPEDAHRAALRSFGGVTQAKEVCQQVRSFTWLDDFRQDLRYAIRALRRSPGFTIVACVTLALGIGANSAIFSIVNSLLLRPLPVPEPDRLVTISSEFAVRFGFTAGAGWNYPMWERLRQRAEAFDGALAFTADRFNLAQGGETESVDGLYVSGEFFTTVGVPALLGRTFTPVDDVRGGGPDGPVAVISHRLWQRRFGGAASIIGTPVTLEGVPFTIIGVTPPEFLHVEIGRTFDVAVPLGTQPLIPGEVAATDQPRALILIVMLRLKPEQSLEAATATVRAMQPDILGVTPDELARVRPPNLAEPFTLVPASAGTSGAAGSGLRQQYERPLLAILIIVALVLMIACANLANLLLARATARGHELSVRRALGASRWRLARQWLLESFVLAVLGAAIGLAIAAWGSRMLVAQLSTAESPITLNLSFDWVVLAYTSAVTVATVMFFGTVPALRATRIAPIEALKAHGVNAGSGGVAPSRVTYGGSSTLVIAQVAFSLVLMAAAGLLIRTFDELASVPLGFDPDRVLVIDVDTARARVDPAARFAYYDRLVDAVVNVPGVTHAAASIWTPLSGGGLIQDAQGRAVFSERVVTNFVTPTWFDVYEIGIMTGRDFDHRDAANALPVAIVNETFVRKFLEGRHAIGETVQGTGSTRRTVVGVVTDAVFGRSLRDTTPPMMYVPLVQSAGFERLADTAVRLSVRSNSEQSGSVARSIGTALTAVSRDLAFSSRPLADYVDEALARERLVAVLSGFFGALAVFLAATGLYGVTAYTAMQRRTEIAIRMALGAQRAEVLGLAVRRALSVTAIGISLGLVIAAAVTRYLEALLFGVTPVDRATFIGVSLILVAVAAVASCVPARSAMNVDPMVALRTE